MLASMEKRGWSCVGTEFSEESSEYARGLGLSVEIPSENQDPLDLVTGPLGVITAWHVLEHIAKPRQALDRFHRLLEPAGLMALEVPNFSSGQARLSREHWIYTECPRHLAHFSPKSLTGMLAEVGFEVKAIGTFSLEYGVFGLLQSLLNLVCPYKNLLFFLLRNRTAQPPRPLGSFPALFSLAVTLVLFVPLLLVAALAELVLSFFSAGGVVTILAQKRSDSPAGDGFVSGS